MISELYESHLDGTTGITQHVMDHEIWTTTAITVYTGCGWLSFWVVTDKKTNNSTAEMWWGCGIFCPHLGKETTRTDQSSFFFNSFKEGR